MKERLKLSDEANELLINTFQKISFDDTNKVEIYNKEMLDFMYKNKILVKPDGENITTLRFPEKRGTYVVTSQTDALDLDNVAESYRATEKNKNPYISNIQYSTADAVYIDENKETYIIEFKNGRWEWKDLRFKIEGTEIILKNLDLLDGDSILSENGKKTKKEVSDLRLKTKLEEAGYQSTDQYWKEKVHYWLVFTGDNLAQNIQKLFELRDDFTEIEAFMEKENILKKMKVRMPASDLLGLSLENINAIAALMLNIKTNNRNADKFDAFTTMAGRLRMLQTKDESIQKHIDFLNGCGIDTIKKLCSFLNYNETIDNASDFMMKLIANSVSRINTHEASTRYFCDDYEFVTGSLDIIDEDLTPVQKKIDGYVGKYRGIFKIQSEVEDRLHKITENLEDKFKNNVEEALRDIQFITVMKEDTGAVELTIQQIKGLLVNVLEMPGVDAGKIANILETEKNQEIANAVKPKDAEKTAKANKMTKFFHIVALGTQINGSWDWLRREDYCNYWKIRRQVQYVKMLIDVKISKRTKGALYQYCISSKNKRNTPEERFTEVEEKIIEGYSLAGICSLESAFEIFIDQNEAAEKIVKDLYEKKKFVEFRACKGVDFEM